MMGWIYFSWCNLCVACPMFMLIAMLVVVISIFMIMLANQSQAHCSSDQDNMAEKNMNYSQTNRWPNKLLFLFFCLSTQWKTYITREIHYLTIIFSFMSYEYRLHLSCNAPGRTSAIRDLWWELTDRINLKGHRLRVRINLWTHPDLENN